MIWTNAWLVWGAIFGVIETLALIFSRTGTLSDTIRAWAGVRSRHWTWRRWVLLAFMIWLTGHLAFGWPPS